MVHKAENKDDQKKFAVLELTSTESNSTLSAGSITHNPLVIPVRYLFLYKDDSLPHSYQQFPLKTTIFNRFPSLSLQI